MVLGEVLRVVLVSRLPLHIKIFNVTLVLDPVEAHVHCLGPLLLDVLVDDDDVCVCFRLSIAIDFFNL